MERSSRNERIFDWLWLLAWGIFSSVWCITAATQLGATFDEPQDLARGMEWWRAGSHHALMKVGAMPLPMDIDTLPIYLWERWHQTQIDLLGKDLEQALPWARAGTLWFWWLLLIYGGVAGRQLAGVWGGRLVVALLACEPSLLAHATLATKDIAVSACLLALVYHFHVGRTGGWLARIGLPIFWFGISLLAKASALAFGPLCMLAVEIFHLWQSRASTRPASEEVDSKARVRWLTILASAWEKLRPFRRDFTQIAAGGFLLSLVYCGSDWRTQASFVAWAHHLPEGSGSKAMVWVAENLRIFSNAGEGLVRQITHNMRGHDGSYILGQTSPRAFWYYFPVALSMKLSITLLALPLILVAVRPRSLSNWACIAAAALLVFSLNCRVQIGIRLVLPLVVLAIVGLGGACAAAMREMAIPWKQRGLAMVLGSGIAWTALAAVLVWPEGLCYTNAFWGGTDRGYLCLSDSNYDWGQGLRELGRWRQQHKLAEVDVWYFGTDPALNSPGFHSVPLHALPIARAEDLLDRVRGHYLAVSTTLLYGIDGNSRQASVTPTPQQRSVAFLRARQPVDRTPTFFIYDFTAGSVSEVEATGVRQLAALPGADQ